MSDELEPGHAAEPPHQDGHAVGLEPPAPAEVTPRRAILIGLVVIVVLAAAFFTAYLPRQRQHTALVDATRTAEKARRRVEVVSPKPLSSGNATSLPGTVKALEETVVYSRASGYVRAWKVDIGDKVEGDQLLAQIETPELDQELAQARAQLAQAEAGITQANANREFSKSSLERYRKLAASGVATQQELDQRAAQADVDVATVNMAKAVVGTQRANLARLEQLKSFARVVAPFAGTVTARTIDRGSLVAPGTTAPLFRIAATDPVRVFVDAPQNVAPSVRADMTAVVTVREYPGREFRGRVARSAGALDPASRTLSTEIRVPNGDGALLAGMYADVRLTLPIPHRILELPATAILTDASGTRVQVVAPDGSVRFARVVIERDLGQAVYVAEGVEPGDRVVKIGSAELAEGTHVDIAG